MEKVYRTIQTLQDGKTKGGQHRAPQGDSTFDDETDQERSERHRRAYREIASTNEPLLRAMDEGA